MTNIETQSPVILTGRKLSAVKWGWWVLFVVYTIFRGFAVRNHLLSYLTKKESIYPVIMITLIFIISSGLALYLFAKKPGNWMAICAATMFATWDTSSMGFLEWIFNVNAEANGYTSQYLLILNLDTCIFFFSIISATGFFLSFPNGRWLSSSAGKMFWGAVIFSITCAIVFPFLFILHSHELAISILLISQVLMMFYTASVCGIMLLVHYRKMKNSVQRQQIKWVVVFCVLGAALIVLFAVAYLILVGVNILLPPYITLDVNDYLQNLLSISVYAAYTLEIGLFFSLAISIFRYRLWDIEELINNAVIYSSLTGLLGLLGAASLAVINYFIKQRFEEDSSVWAGVIAVLPIAAAFNPLRDRVQKIVDYYFKPKEVNFENHFLEFRSDIRDILGTSRIIEIVSRQVKKQLDVEFARIYLMDENSKIPSLSVSDKLLKKLTAGEVVVGEDNTVYSLLVPLVVERPVIPDFIGVMVLGHRLNGRGYSTHMLESLKLFGKNAGEAIYLSQLNKQSKIKVMA